LLSYLKVKDFALIEDVEVEFQPGFNVLTGETGAGKTVLVGAIALLLGERADSLQVRQGAGAADFSCSFDLAEQPETRDLFVELGVLEEGNQELILGRTVSKEGKSRCTVNGKLNPVSTLSEIGDMLVDIHGQNTHQALLKTGSHLDYLDRFAGTGHIRVLSEYREHYRLLKSFMKERAEAAVGGRDTEREVELLRLEIEEIEQANPQPGEIDEREKEARKLRHAEELRDIGSRVARSLSADEERAMTARGVLLQAARDLGKMASHDAAIERLARRVESLSFEVEDIASGLGDYCDRLDTDPARLEEVETRLSTLRTLERKYGGSIDGAMAYRDDAVDKLEQIENSLARADEIEKRIETEEAELTRLADMLSRGRAKASNALAKAVLRELAELELAGARFEVEMSDGGIQGDRKRGEEELLGPRGRDSVEFTFSSEPEQSPRPLKKIASGGEMSRVMLALKIVLAGADRTPVLIFDEVDSGIGGETAGKVGEKLFQLTRYHQVFCVTHIPSIATFADWQYRVFKRKVKQSARTDVQLLEGDSRVEEMCRMLGDPSGRSVTLEHARDILSRAEKKKKATV